MVTSDGGCDREIEIRLGKANTGKIWACKTNPQKSRSGFMNHFSLLYKLTPLVCRNVVNEEGERKEA